MGKGTIKNLKELRRTLKQAKEQSGTLSKESSPAAESLEKEMKRIIKLSEFIFSDYGYRVCDYFICTEKQ